MIASFHVADLRVVAALSAARRTNLQRTVSGLRHANLAFAAPLGPSVVPRPSLHRVVMVAPLTSPEFAEALRAFCKDVVAAQ